MGAWRFGKEGMSSYSEIARERKRARSMFLELRARGFELLARESPEDLSGYAISLRASLSPALKGRRGQCTVRT